MAIWQEQLDRSRRYYLRLQKFVGAMEHKADIIEGLDDVYAFFQNCYHIKDWLKHDPSFPKGALVEKYVKTTPSLALCADIANGMKHLRLTRMPRSGNPPSALQATLVIELEDSFIQESEALPSMTIQLGIEHAGNMLDAMNIATDALRAWESFV